MKEFASREINFSVIRVNNCCDKMIKVMHENYDSEKRTMNVSDLEKALLTKSAAEVTKDLVAAQSFILSAAITGTTSKKAKKTEPLWDPK